MSASAKLLVVVFVGLVVILGWKYSHRFSRSEQTRMAANVPPGLNNSSLMTAPWPFGYKTAWLAIRSDDPKAVAVALELQNVESTNWVYGVWHAVETDDYQIFITPPVKGWVLAVGMPFLFEADAHQEKRIIELSKRFGEAQFFASMRTSSAYLWARAANGKLVRLFYEGDGTRRTEGGQTPEEKQLNFKFFDSSSPESSQPGYWQRKDLTFVDDTCVLNVADKWSVDPSKLDQMGLTPAFGLLGSPSTNYAPKPNSIRHPKN
jgi:hypothetical protein